MEYLVLDRPVDFGEGVEGLLRNWVVERVGVNLIVVDWLLSLHKQ